MAPPRRERVAIDPPRTKERPPDLRRSRDAALLTLIASHSIMSSQDANAAPEPDAEDTQARIWPASAGSAGKGAGRTIEEAWRAM